MLGVGEPLRVPDQVDRGEVGADGDGEHAAEDRGGVDPARPRVAGLAAGGDTCPDAIAAGDRAHAVGHEHRRDRERGAEVALRRGADDRLAEGEARAAQHDAERGEGQSGTNSVSVIDANASGNAGPQHDEA